MKKVLVIAALLAVMLGLGAWQVDTISATNPMTLAAIGFVLLAAFATAELGSSLSLPQVTGYILAGIVLGPSLANILSGQVVTEMRMFNTLALGLIATSAGLELDVRQIIRLGRTLSATILVKVVLGTSLVGGTLLVMAGFVDVGLPEGAGTEHQLALALVLGVLAVGTSPSITLAVLSETRAKGRVADLVLGAAVFKDLVVVVMLAVGVAVARTLLMPGAELEASVLMLVGQELGGSLVAGALLGGVLIAYMRFIKAEMLLFVAAMILVVAELCRVFHLELLLVFITAGFVVRNLSKYEHDLMGPLELVALPVFVVFFTNAGAGIDLATAWKILPLAIALCAARALAYYVAARFGSHVGQESPLVRKNAWLAYLPQAGVTLGLVGLAAQQLPGISSAIATTGMAVVAINLLIGPITLRKALQDAGEIPADATVTPDPTTGADSTPTVRTKTPLPPRASTEWVRDHQSLGAAFSDLERTTLETLREFRTSVLPQLPPLPSATPEPGLEDFERFVSAHRAACRQLFDDLLASLATLPVSVSAELEPIELQAKPGDLRVLRLRLWRRRLFARLIPRLRKRRVLVRLAARITIERGFAELAYALYERNIYQHLSQLGRRDHSVPPSAQGDELLERRVQEKLHETFEDFASMLRLMGTPRLPARSLRFSGVEPEIRTAIEALEPKKVEYWARRAQAVWGSTLAQSHVRDLETEVRQALLDHVVGVAQANNARTPAALGSLRELLRSFAEECQESPTLDPATVLRRWQSQFDAKRKRELDEPSRGLRASAAVRGLTQQLKRAMSSLPSSVRCLQVGREQLPASGTIRRVEVRALAERYLVRGLVPSIDQITRSASNLFAQLPRRAKEALDPSWTTLAAVAEHQQRGDFRERAADELALGVRRLELIEERLERQLKSNLEQIDQQIEAALVQLRDHIELQDGAAATRQRWLQGVLDSVRGRVNGIVDWLQRHSPTVKTLRDATDLRRAVERWRGERLNEPTLRWFSQRPVRDERIFSAQRELLEAVVDEESAWLAGERRSVLLRGSIGSGKSSLLNICELELHSARTLRLDGQGPEQTGTVFEALGIALGCEASDAALERQLSYQTPAILIDNLDTWIARSRDRVAELERLLSLITRTQSTAFWFVAIERTALDAFDELCHVSEVFTRVLQCRPLSAAELSELVETRRHRAGLQMTFRRTALGAFLGRVGLGGERDLYFRTLVNTTGGNPGRALAEVVRSATLRDGQLQLDATALRRGRARVAQALTTAQLAILATVVRHGPTDLDGLRQELGLPREQLERHLAFLAGASLLELVREGVAYDLPSSSRWLVVLELQRLGAVG